MKPVEERIADFNEGRMDELLQLKYKNMRQDIFGFYRGTSHLYYEDIAAADNKTINESPATWVSGDLHLENYGSYKADNRLVYFDINDFDDAAIAPCLWEVSRLLVSILVAIKAKRLGDKASAEKLCTLFIETYSQTLIEGHARLIEEETAESIVYTLLHKLRKRKRKNFIDQRTKKIEGKRKILTDGVHAIALPENLKKDIATSINEWAKGKADNDFYKIIDIARRIAGTGSLGLERYVALIKGKGEPDNYLLDIKFAKPSSVILHTKIQQPAWTNEVQRIIEIQKRMQAFPPALLEGIKLSDKWFVLKELQPMEDRVDLITCGGRITHLDCFIKNVATLTAWAQLRSSGRQGSAIADTLIEFATKKDWHKGLEEYINSYFVTIEGYYKTFSAAYDKNYFKR